MCIDQQKLFNRYYLIDMHTIIQYTYADKTIPIIFQFFRIEIFNNLVRWFEKNANRSQ